MAATLTLRWSRLPLCYLIAAAALTTVRTVGSWSDGTSLKLDKQDREEEDPTRLPRIAQLLLFKMNISVKPCDNFYRYACGRFIQSQLNRSEGDVHVHEQLASHEQHKLIKRLDEYADSKPEGLPAAVKTAVNIYRTCRNGSEEKVAEKFIFDEGHRIIADLGGWPLIDPGWSGLPRDETVFTLMGKTDRNHGCAAMLQPEVLVDMKNVTYHAMAFLAPTLPVFHDLESAINSTITDFISVLFPEKNITEELRRDIETVFSAVTNLRNEIEAALEERTEWEDLYNPYTLSDLEKRYKNIHWDEYLTALLNTTEENLKDMHFIVHHPEAIAVIDTFFANCTNKPCNRTLINFLVMCSLSDWRAAAQMVHGEQNEDSTGEETENAGSRFSSKAFRTGNEGQDDDDDDDDETEEEDEENGKYNEYSGEEDRDDDESVKKRVCMRELINALPIVTGRIYVTGEEENFRQKRHAVKYIFRQLMHALQEQTKNVSWMDANMLLQAQMKTANVARNVGYPKWMMNDTELDDYYAALSATVNESTTAAENFLRTIAFTRQAELSKMFRHANRHEFFASPADFSLFYLPFYNSITVSALLMNPPLFNRSFPWAVKFGGMGSMLGHELGHGLTGMGFNFMANGTLHRWMSNQSEPKLKEKAQCFIDQYSNVSYEINGTRYHINGTRTEDENLSDNIGLKAAYDAFKRHSDLMGEEERIRGMTEYSMDKIFFLAFAQTWCESTTDEGLRQRLIEGPHSPPEARVNEALKNMPEFASTFHCKNGMPMVPTKRCSVWE